MIENERGDGGRRRKREGRREREEGEGGGREEEREKEQNVLPDREKAKGGRRGRAESGTRESSLPASQAGGSPAPEGGRFS